MGRMYCYALAADGDAGVHKMLELLEHEVGVAMALSGARSLNELNPSFIHRDAPNVAPPSVVNCTLPSSVPANRRPGLM